MSDDPVQSEEPEDRLTRISDAMSDVFHNHPELEDGDQCVVFIEGGGRGGIVVVNYEDVGEAVAAVLLHIKAMMQSAGKSLDIMFLGEDGIDRVG